MRNIIALIALAAVGSTTQSIAQALSSTEQNLTRHEALDRADRLFLLFDLKHHGLVTRDEAKLVGARLLIQRAATGRDVAPGIGGHTLKYLERAFALLDAVTKPQFEQAMLAHFDEMDANHDGILTTDERNSWKLASR